MYSYDEDDAVANPNLEKHLAHFGLRMKEMKKSEKSTVELELDMNQVIPLSLTIFYRRCIYLVKYLKFKCIFKISLILYRSGNGLDVKRTGRIWKQYTVHSTQESLISDRVAI